MSSQQGAAHPSGQYSGRGGRGRGHHGAGSRGRGECKLQTQGQSSVTEPPTGPVINDAPKTAQQANIPNTPPIISKIQKPKIESKLKATAPEFVPGLALESADVKDDVTANKTTRLLTNYFKFVFKAPTVFRYACTDRSLGPKLHELFGAYAFDGDNILALKKLDQGTTTLKLIKEISSQDILHQETQGIINVMLKRIMKSANLVQLGRAFFWPKPKDVQGLQLFEGFVNAVTPCQLGWHLVVDKVHRVLHRETVRDVMNRLLQEKDEKSLKDELQGSMTLDDEFELKNGTKTNFRKYYAEQYGLKLDGKDHGLIVCLPSSKKSVKPIFLVPELCHLTGITDAMRSNWKLTKALADTTRMPPSERVKSVHQLLQTILGNPQVAEEMKKLQIEIKLEPASVQAHILGPVNIIYNPKKGGPTKYCLMYDKKDHELADKLIAQVTKLGSWPEPTWVPIESGVDKTKVERWTQGINQVKKEKPGFVISLLPFGDSDLYNLCKYHFCSVSGVISQCVSATTLAKSKDRFTAICGNIYKQIMAKCGNQLWRMDWSPLQSILNGPTMVVGLDVSHDKKMSNAMGDLKQEGRVSTVGFCASYDKDFTAYNPFVSFQPAGQEYVAASKDLMLASLKSYHQVNKAYPSNILVFRDGVGNSQIESFVRKEIAFYEAAFKDLGLESKVKLTVLTVQKRISTRLYAVCEKYSSKGQKQCSTDAKCNGQSPHHSPAPGTVVDKDIVHPGMRDFFMISSVAPKNATARPTRYIVVRDDLKCSDGLLHSLTNQLCWMYYGWSGSIRVPAPCMYGHKLAYLFGKHLSCVPHETLRNLLFYL